STYVCYRAFKYTWDRCNLIAPSSLVADSVTTITADLYWNNNPKFSGFTLQYKECDSATWLSVPLDTNFYQLDGLQPNTCYDWRVQSVCEMYDDSFTTVQQQFTTLNPLSVIAQENTGASLRMYPNPSSDATVISFVSEENYKAEFSVRDLSG